MEKNNILNDNSITQILDWKKTVATCDNIEDKELIDILKKYNQSLPKNQLKGTTINTDTYPQKEKTKKKCNVKCGCHCKKRIEDLEDQVDILLDIVCDLMEDSATFYQFITNHETKKRKYKKK